MKRFFFIAAALLAAVACAREPVLPEKPEEPAAEQRGPIQVTLVAGEPETRTELGTDSDHHLQPYWSVGDNITLVRVPDDEDDEDDFEWDDDEEDYVYHLFSSVLSQKSLTARFTGNVDNGGQYRAFYPEQTLFYRWGEEFLIPRLDGYSIAFNIPPVQHPSITSFDPSADLLVSAPFEIPAGDDQAVGAQAVGAQAPDIPICFTRVNAIVKVTFNPTGDLRNKLAGQTVKKVVLGYYSSPEGEEDGYVAPETRVSFLSGPDDDEGHGLTGQVYYCIPFVPNLSQIEEFNVNEYDELFVDEYESYRGVVAEYLDESFTIVDPDNPQAATYFIVAPSIMKNTEYNGEIDGLPIEIYTEDYVIRRNIILPDKGIALQPSVVTTLNITLSDSNAEVVKKGISFDKNETTLIPGDGEFVDLNANEISFPRDLNAEDFEEYFTVNAVDDENNPADISVRYISNEEYEDGEYESYSSVGDECNRIYDLYLSVADGVDPGNYDVTITYEGCTATCAVHVLDKNQFADEDFIVFRDSYVKEICVAWGGRIRTGELSKYEASKVTTLDNAFKGNTVIQFFDEFEFFTGLTDIDNNAFDGCTSLERIKLPKNITMIEDHSGTGYAFRGCTSLTSVDLSACTVLERIGSSAFEGCTSLTTITLPASVKSIGSDAFRGCTALTEVVIPSKSQLESIYGEYNYWTSPNQHGAFYGCSSLSSIWLPPTLKKIGYAAFMNCSSLSSINIPQSVNELGSYAFSGCESLGSISIPVGIETINEYTFRDCRMLSEVILPEGLTSIKKFAFFYCTGLHEIEFPASLTSFGYWSGENLVFYGVEFRSGTDNEGNEYHGVKFRGSTPPSFEKADITIKGKHWDATVNDWVDGVVVYVPSGSKDAYLAVSNINPDVENRESFFVEY